MSSKPVLNQPVSSQTVIDVKQVSKCYFTYNKPVQRLWHTLFPQKPLGKPFWALQDVSLQVKAGETVGLVGKNGSGKSTLLQIITGILRPTHGSSQTDGRISALLELGAGFNPEFTGIENARLNATIMGLSPQEFAERLPDIIEFSGLGDFLERPVKTYSSGMYVRLAFAVAINMEPDVLIIDEALAVGDIRFQSKCFRRLDELKKRGVSILFVTHSTESVLKYCDRAVLLNDGQVLKTGSPKDVVQQYMEMMFDSDEPKNQTSIEIDTAAAMENEAADDVTGIVAEKSATYVAQSTAAEKGFIQKDPNIDHCLKQVTYNDNEERWGDQRARIYDYAIDVDGRTAKYCQPGQRVTITADIVFMADLENLIYGITVKTPDGNPVYGSNTRLLAHTLNSEQGNEFNQQQAGDRITVRFAFDAHLLANDYFISLGVAQEHPEKDNVAIDRRYDMIHWRIDNAGAATAFGLAALDAEIAFIERHDVANPTVNTVTNSVSNEVMNKVTGNVTGNVTGKATKNVTATHSTKPSEGDAV